MESNLQFIYLFIWYQAALFVGMQQQNDVILEGNMDKLEMTVLNNIRKCF